MSIKVIFGKVLREFRKQKGFSQEQLANDADLDRSYISKLETGVYQPSISTLFAISEVLEIDPSIIVKQAYEVYLKENWNLHPANFIYTEWVNHFTKPSIAMRSDQAKTISISSYLEQVEGIKPKSSRLGGKELWYNSPIRQGDKTPSFKVDTILNLWFDHGLSKGGKIIDLVCEIRNVSVREALAILENSGLLYDNYTPSYTSNKNTPLFKKNTASQKNKPAIEKEKSSPTNSHILLAEKELNHPSLIQYLQERHIDLEIAKKHLKEIDFKQADKLVQYFALGWKNGNGYDARNKYFKGYIGTGKNISVINPKADNELIVFEGFIDYLSYLTYLQNEKGIKEVKATVVVLNSTALKKTLTELAQQYKFSKAYFFLDNDISGTETLDYFNESLNDIELVDMSHLYSEHKDFNEWFCNIQA